MKGLVTTASELLPRQTVCHDEAQVHAVLEHIRQGKGLRVVSFLNKDAIMFARRDDAFHDALMTSNCLFRDGIGLAIIMTRAGMDPGLNMNGTDLIPRIVEMYDRNTTLALFGTRAAALSGAADALRKRGFEKIETLDGFQDTEAYINHLRTSDAKLVILGMGMPKQELVARAIATTHDLATRDMLVVNGGAILDFMSGKITRAPDWMRRYKLEWVYRTSREPSRLLKRTLSTLPLLAEAYLLGGRISRRIADNDLKGA